LIPLERMNWPPIVTATNAGIAQRRSRSTARPVTATAVARTYRVPPSSLTARIASVDASVARSAAQVANGVSARANPLRVLIMRRIAPAVAVPMATSTAARPSASAVAADGVG
jgi:hypothetical protein